MTRLLMTADAVGGVWQYAEELAGALAPHGIETVIAVLGPTLAGREEPGVGGYHPAAAGDRPTSGPFLAGRGEPRVIHTGLPLDWLATGPEQVLATADAVAALAAEVRADIVQLNAPALAAGTRFPVPVVAVAHGCVGTWWRATRGTAPDAAYAWHGKLMADGLRAADAVVAPSAAFADTLRQTYDLATPPLVVHNGRTTLATPAGDPADAVLTAGRLWDEAKRTALLDAVAARIDAPFRAAGPLSGPGGEAVSVRHLDALGSLAEPALAAELAHRPIFVSAAVFEPFGLAVLEAAAAGCPLVLSDIDTFRELWTGAALLVPADDADAFAVAIGRLRADPELRRHLGEAARLRSARYTPAATAAAMAAIYAGLIASPERAAAA